jgi:hypothetical protein
MIRFLPLLIQFFALPAHAMSAGVEGFVNAVLDTSDIPASHYSTSAQDDDDD